ncbi:MAG: Gldg family protein [Verrucomicrobiota bacterium]
MMKTAANFRTKENERRSDRLGASQLTLTILLAAGLILALGGLWFSHRTSLPPASAPATPPTPGLSEATQKILAGLPTSIEVRFFAPDDAVTLPENLRSYIMRVSQLLAEYERGAAGKLRINRADPQTDLAAKTAAGAAGVVPFGSETGEIVYLGLTVGNGAQIESITPLTPEWETALESDLSRAIQRLTTQTASVKPTRSGKRATAQPDPINPATSEQLLKMFPDLATRSYDSMAQELRTATLEEFKVATAELQTKVSAAQQALADAQANKSAAEQQEALQNFQRVQAEQAEKLKGITAWLQERLTVLQRLKTAPELSTPVR